MDDSKKLEFFVNAFETKFADYEGECRCGRHFHCTELLTWPPEGEFEAYKPPFDSTGLDYRVHFISFENKTYVIDCECWQERANKIMGFIGTHDTELAEYLNAITNERRREAEKVQIVKILSSQDIRNIENGR